MIWPRDLNEFAKGARDSLAIRKSGPATAACLAVELASRGACVVLVAGSSNDVARLSALARLFSARDPDSPDAPGPRFLGSFTPSVPSAAAFCRKAAFLHAAASRAAGGVFVVSVDNFLPRWPHPETLESACIRVRRGEDLPRELLLESLVEHGYRRQPLVSDPGHLAARGDLLDFFAPGYALPVRLEFFGDTVETIRLFEPGSQRSSTELEEVLILPAAPSPMPGPNQARALAVMAELAGKGELPRNAEAAFAERVRQADATLWPGLASPDTVSLEAYFPSDTVFIPYGAGSLKARLEEAELAWRQFLAAHKAETGYALPRNQLLWPEGSGRQVWTGRRQLVFEDLVMGEKKEGLELSEKPIDRFVDLFWRPDQARRPWHALMESLRQWTDEGKGVALSFHSSASRGRFLKMAGHEGLSFALDGVVPEQGLSALVGPFRGGMELPWRNTLILSEDVLSPKEAAAERPTKSKTGFEGLAAYDDLEEGELLVHRDYGLGRFAGLHRVNVGAAANDYLLVLFDGDDRLYLPVDRFNLVQRFKGPEGVDPHLDRLGGTRWKAAQEKAKKAIEKIAADLVEMYAFRKVAKGFAYGPLSELYWEFEAGFGFEETPDQDRAISDVLADMEKPEPMDRLVCGDVGFGKTEVALRAAFRAVLDGKQVALLCPTTVLAEQHYLTFSRRMEGFPVNVGMLSRFVAPKAQKAVLDRAARGELDILIGTHRLLSKDVELPRLGLLVLDEEQRFGVKHKEKIKQLRKNIDVLTLSATPIPRTLQLSLSGIRSLSVIETPPADRKPVETALIERDKGALKKVLEREIEREGQVFWVHNRVEGLARAAEFVRELVPTARIAMAHGQMPEKELESAMHAFWHGEVDVLVCTAIVESGLDFPRANTLIVDGAQMFGLGQLYQLRGRVGRSDRQAYAYFVVHDVDKLSALTKKRLQIILDMDYLGAGFAVAMEDLRLRGAGNILGEVQSGSIARIGLDLFLEMLDDEVRRLKGDPRVNHVETEINFGFAARIPETYVEDNRERLSLYKRLSSADNESTLALVAAEMRDRFGHAPDEVEHFLAALHLKLVLCKLSVARADLGTAKIGLTFASGEAAPQPDTLVAFLKRHQARAKLSPPARLELRLEPGLPLPRALSEATSRLAELLP